MEWKKENKFAKGKELTEEEQEALYSRLGQIYGAKLDKSHDEEVFKESESNSPMSRSTDSVGTDVYGEITLFGVERVIRKFGEIFSQDDTVFYDIGCGLGRMSCHVRA